MPAASFLVAPPHPLYAHLSFPSPHILLVTLNRPKSLNCINTAGNNELHEIWSWFDDEPSLRIGIITGEGRAFCAGADLKGAHSTPSKIQCRYLISDDGQSGIKPSKQKKNPEKTAQNQASAAFLVGVVVNLS